MQAVNDIMKYVTDDINKYEGILRPVKASLFERLTTKDKSVSRLHPNPADEFSMPEIGPSMRVISQYEQTLKHCMLHDLPIFDERVIVEKTEPNGYMILNGHHRWAAALRMGVPKIRVELVNLTHDNEIRTVLENSSNTKRATFELEEVVLASEGENSEPLKFPYSKLYKEPMRLGISTLMLELKARGYDIWVFTSGYYSQKYLHKYFEAHGVQVTGVVNGIRRDQKNHAKRHETFKEEFRKKYQMSIIMLRDSVIYTNSIIKDYEILDIDRTRVGATKEIIAALDEIESRYENSLLED